MRDANGMVLPPNHGGLLVVETPLPYMFATVWNDPHRFAQYFPWGVYVAGDVATIDEDGYVTVRAEPTTSSAWRATASRLPTWKVL